MLTIAVKAARRAGNIINRGARELDLLTVTSKGPKDFVSEVDREAERAIVEVLLASFPDHGILAEEGTAKGTNADAENVWIIDPLDGTTNFLHGGQVIAATPKIFAQMVATLAPFRAELARDIAPQPIHPAP